MSVNFEHPKDRRGIIDLDENSVVEILSHLPYEHVMVSRSVCKIWNSLISTPYFVRRFLRHRLRIRDSSEMEKEQPWTFMYIPSNDSNLLYSWMKMVPKLTSRHSVFRSPAFSLRFVPCFDRQQEEIYVVRTFNDLILCCKYKCSDNYYICNPITMEYVALPCAPLATTTELYVDFICEPYYQKQPQNDDIDVVLNAQYRFWVMQVEQFITEDGLTVQIFSSETGKWKEYPVSIPEGFFAGFEDKQYSHRVNSLAFHRNKILISTVTKRHEIVRRGVIKVSCPNNNLNIKNQLGPLRKFAQALEFELEFLGIKFWKLDENDFEWRFAGRVYWNEIDSYIVKENLGFRATTVDFHGLNVLGLDPHNQNLVYFNKNNIGMVKFNTESRTFDLLRNNVFQVEKHNRSGKRFFPIVMPFWPTPMPQISSS